MAILHRFFSFKWAASAAKNNARQKIMHNSVKTYDMLLTLVTTHCWVQPG